MKGFFWNPAPRPGWNGMFELFCSSGIKQGLQKASSDSRKRRPKE